MDRTNAVRHEFPSGRLDQVALRLPDGMRDDLKQDAARNNRSLNAEIVARLKAPDGMSLRDWFAGQALTGIVGPNYDWFTSGTEQGSRTYEAAAFAYSLADAMLAVREVLE